MTNMHAAALMQSGTASAQRIAVAGWHWWRAEILAMVPAPVRAAIERQRETAVLAIGETGATLRLPNGAEAMPLRLSGPQADRHAAAIRRSLPKHLRISLPPQDVLRTTLILPAAVEENLGEVLQFELDRRTPFAADEARFAYRIVYRDRTAGQVHVELAVVSRPAAANAVAAAKQMGLKPDALDLSAQPGAGELLVDLHETGRRRSRTVPLRSVRLWIGILALAVAAVGLFAPIVQSRNQVLALRQQVAAARTQAEKAAKLDDEVTRLSTASAFLVARKAKEASAIALLAEMTRQLPDGTWLEEFSLDPKTVKLVGYSNSSSGLIPLLTKSALIVEPHFDSPVTTDTASGRERFEIGARRADAPEAKQ